MQISQNAVTVYRQLMLEVGDRLLDHLWSIALEVAVAQQRLTDGSPTESIREPVKRAAIELDVAEHDLRNVLATIALNSAAAPGSHDSGQPTAQALSSPVSSRTAPRSAALPRSSPGNARAERP